MNVPIWPGSSSFTGSTNPTPFGFYDNDPEFEKDADKVAKFCAQRLGYPLVDVELQSGSFYTAFEEAVTTYGNELYAFKVRDNILALAGLDLENREEINDALIVPNMGFVVELSQQYAEEAGVGGNVTYYSGSINLTSSRQSYDLKTWASQSGISTDGVDGPKGIEIKRVFYEAPPAIVRYFDPYGGTGTGMMGLMDSFGWGGYSPGVNFLMMPLNFDLQKLQAIEMNDMIRRSNYSFEIQNNTLKIFPIPYADSGSAGKVWIQYIKKQDRTGGSVITSSTDIVTNVSNVPYANPDYSKINSIGRQWIFEYTLALSKEMLGYVRGKYSTVPIPNASVTLNQSDLLGAATAEKTALLERLRTYFDETSRRALLERKAQESDFIQDEFSKVPYTIYIG